MAEYGNKEAVYDEKIDPLVDEIIAICKENGINMVASFQLTSEKESEKGNYICTTVLPEQKDHFPDLYRFFAREIHRKPSIIAIAISKVAKEESGNETPPHSNH